MQIWQHLIILTVICFDYLIALTRDFQLLQLNSYYVSRYFRNYRFDKKGLLFFNISDVIVKLSILLFVNNFYVLLIFSVFSLFVTFKLQSAIQLKAIKKLVFTNRIIRLYISAFLLFVLLVFLTYIFNFNSLALSVIFILKILSPIIISILKFINEPVEAAYRAYYTYDAKKKLKSLKNTKIIGITGSFGKTSTKHVLERILSESFNVAMTPGGINTPMGIVRVIRESLTSKANYFICEMGAKNIGDIKEICDIVHPDIGIITTVGPMHLDTFKTVDNIKKTKLELADSVFDKKGKVYFNGDNEYLAPEKSVYNARTFGLNSYNDFWAENIIYSKDGTEFDFCGNHFDTIHLRTKLLGKNNLLNIILAIGVALDLGVPPSDIKFAVSKLKPVEHRLELKPFINGSVLIDDAYNANPIGAKEAINVLNSFDCKNKICVTPGLIELGDKEYFENEQLGKYMADKCTKIILVGEQRSIPIKSGVLSVNPDADVTVVKSFFEALDILKMVCDENTVCIFENDLPDNYLK